MVKAFWLVLAIIHSCGFCIDGGLSIWLLSSWYSLVLLSKYTVSTHIYIIICIYIYDLSIHYSEPWRPCRKEKQKTGNPTLRLMERLCLKCPVGKGQWMGIQQLHDSSICWEDVRETRETPMNDPMMPLKVLQQKSFCLNSWFDRFGSVIILGTYEGINLASCLEKLLLTSRRPWSSQKDVAELPPCGGLVSWWLSPCEAWVLPVKEFLTIHFWNLDNPLGIL